MRGNTRFPLLQGVKPLFQKHIMTKRRLRSLIDAWNGAENTPIRCLFSAVGEVLFNVDLYLLTWREPDKHRDSACLGLTAVTLINSACQRHCFQNITDVFSTRTSDSYVQWVLCSGNQISVRTISLSACMTKKSPFPNPAFVLKWHEDVKLMCIDAIWVFFCLSWSWPSQWIQGIVRFEKVGFKTTGNFCHSGPLVWATPRSCSNPPGRLIYYFNLIDQFVKCGPNSYQ